MSVSQMSLLAWKGVKTKLGIEQKRVYDVIEKLQPVTCDGVAEYLHKFPHEISGRFTEMRNMGVIGSEGRGKTRTGNSATLWSTRDPNDKKLQEQDCEV